MNNPAEADDGSVTTPTGHLSNLSSTGYRAIESLRIRLLGASLKEDSSIQDLVRICLLDLNNIVRYEVCSVYILDRLGEMKRVGSCRASEGALPELEVFPEEDWRRCMLGSGSHNGYADIFIANADEIDPADPLKAPFEAAVGHLDYLVRLPLNGSSRTFGLLEAANRQPHLSPAQQIPVSSDRDLRRLIFIASTLASTITLWRARNESLVLADVMRRLAQAEISADSDSSEVQKAFGDALSAVLQRLTEYRVAVLRIGSTSDSVKIFAKAKDKDLSWDGWKDIELRSGEYLAGNVYASGKSYAVPDIEAERQLFANLDWVQRSKLRSCACYPLITRDKTIGTLTIYTGFYYTFSDLDGSLMTTISDAFALFLERLQAEQERSDAEEELSKLRGELEDRRVWDARQAAILPYVTLLHQSKNSWIEALALLRKRGSSAIPMVITVGERITGMLSGGVIMDTRSSDTIDVLAAVSEIVKGKQATLRSSRIKLTLEPASPIPLIKMPRSLFNEVLYNLLSNSERAIRKAKRAKGQIDIRIGTEKAKHEEELVITITDNGVGIPRDKLEKIFERGFTTFGDSGGTGLGLFLALDIVKEFRGTIRADSQLGDGATFTVRLPLSWVGA